MITHPNAKTILCYGDSNTHGQIPATYSRYAANARWTGILQEFLSDAYDIVEEGLGGRTVNLSESGRPGRNGYEYFVPCLSSHQPLDQVIVMLGTNDLKTQFDRPVGAIVDGLKLYVESAKKYTANVLLVSPIILNPQASQWSFFGEDCFTKDADSKSAQFAVELEKLATAMDCQFVAADNIAKPGIDGIHMDEMGHRALAVQLATKIKDA